MCVKLSVLGITIALFNAEITQTGLLNSRLKVVLAGRPVKTSNPAHREIHSVYLIFGNDYHNHS